MTHDDNPRLRAQFTKLADGYYLELIDAVRNMAEGKQATVRMFGLDCTIDDILYQIIENQPAADVLRLFYPGQVRSSAGEKMIEGWCWEQAKKMAEHEGVV